MSSNVPILNWHVQVLKYLFLWPKDCFTKKQNKFFSYGYFILSTSFAIPVVWASVYQLYVGIEDYNILVEALIAVCDITGYLVVYYCLLKNQETVENILKDIQIFLEFSEHTIITDVDEKCSYYTKYLILYVTIGVSLNVGWPLISKENCIESRGSEFYLQHDPCGMPTQNFYPFDASKPYIFWIVYIIESNYCFHICYAFSLATSIVTGLLMHVIAQLKHCGKTFEQVFNSTEYHENKEQIIKQKFQWCVRYHQVILSYSERIFNVFSTMLIIYVTITSFTLAVISYQIASSKTNVQDRLRYAMLLIGWLLLFSFICFYGQKIKDESMNIADAVYNSNYFEHNTALRRDIILVIARAQKPLTLKAKYMGTISLVRFVSVLKTAYSFFTLLLTVADEK
ncbi:hypothetical protein GWI33_013166 [Rhynchophorus ferrugineus]|uniref:Odorant receptor n=1 Tax=Rhynchophorus ferrugineus TaxID=354439 RepID=A0A834I4A0_RHYFE|nr:hypothetical protein GWI33_013166 [Rhynchophorus ferrugineus]